MTRNINWLVSDWDHRDPCDDLHDIECGLYLQALQNLRDNYLCLLQDSNMHVELREYGGQYHICKIVKKREPEYIQGADKFFIFDSEGKRIPLSEEEYNELLGTGASKEDVFEAADLDLQTIGSEHAAPMDVWDIIFDATEYFREVNRLVDNEEFQALPMEMKRQQLADLAETLIYSADWFPYSQDKRLHSFEAREIAVQIEKGLSRQKLASLLGTRDVVEKNMELALKIEAQAKKLMAGPRKGEMLVKARNLKDAVYKMRRETKPARQNPISDSDRSKLWTLWREREMRVNGEVKLMPWQFKKLYMAKLDKAIVKPFTARLDADLAEKLIDKKEYDQRFSDCVDRVTAMVQERMKKLFQDEKRVSAAAFKPTTPVVPDWLATAPAITEEPTTEDLCADHYSADANASAFMDCSEPSDEDAWVEQQLLSDGGDFQQEY